MLRQLLFLASLADMMIIGGMGMMVLGRIIVLLIGQFFNIFVKVFSRAANETSIPYKDLPDNSFDILARQQTIDRIRKNSSKKCQANKKMQGFLGVPYLRRRSILIGLIGLIIWILLVANLCLIFATKDKAETSISCKRILLSIWTALMVILLGMTLAITYWQDNWKDFGYGELTCRVIVFGVCCLYQYKLSLKKVKKNKMNGRIV